MSKSVLVGYFNFLETITEIQRRRHPHNREMNPWAPNGVPCNDVLFMGPAEK